MDPTRWICNVSGGVKRKLILNPVQYFWENNTNNSLYSYHKEIFFWTSSKKQGLDQKTKKIPSNSMCDKYNIFLNLEREVERLERALLCMTFVVFLWKTD